MRSAAKGSQEEDEYEDDDFGSKKEGPSSNSSNPNSKDAKNNDKASAIRSKHSVTEQRRRSKIDHENPHSSNQALAHFRDAGSGDDSDQAHKRLKS